jgi:hypothetical protein
VVKHIGVVDKAELDADRLFQRREGGSVLHLCHPRFLSPRCRNSPVLSFVHATDL